VKKNYPSNINKMKFYKILCSVLLLTLVSRTSYAVDPSVSVYIDHAFYSSAHTYEFDIMMKANTPTSSFQLRTFQAGLYLGTAWTNGGTITAQSEDSYSEMSGLGYNGAFQWNATDNLVNCSVNYDLIGPVGCIASTVSSTPIVIARIRLSNSVDFTCLAPDIKFNYVSNISPLRLRTTFSWRETGCTVNYEMFYPGRTYGGTAQFNGETYTSGDADGRSTASATNNTGFCLTQLAITAFIEGFYIGSGQMQPNLRNAGIAHAQSYQADTIIVELRSAGNPAVLVYPPIPTILSTTGEAYCILPNSIIGTSCWIVLHHRNSVETWSANPITITSRTSFAFAQ